MKQLLISHSNSLITAVLIKKIRYEIFYVTHIIMYMLILIMVGLHRPRFADKTVIIIIFSATIWSSDRILRGCRILWYSYGNRATVTPLGNGGTRIVLRKSPARAVSRQYFSPVERGTSSSVDFSRNWDTSSFSSILLFSNFKLLIQKFSTGSWRPLFPLGPSYQSLRKPPLHNRIRNTIFP